MCPTPWLAPGSPKRPCARCSSQDDAVAGCSRRKRARAPRSSWARSSFAANSRRARALRST
eukprot:8493722-Alexandrium_andersonii.AAC.1